MSKPMLLGASALAMLLSTTAIRAQVTAQQVWDNWKSLSTASGQTVTTESEQMSGDTLTVTGMVMTTEQDGTTVTGEIDEISFREVGDGTVEITMSPDYALTIDAMDDQGRPTSVGIAISQTGMKMVAGGDATTTTYDYSADGLSVSTAEVTRADVAVPLNLAFTANGAVASYALKSVAADVVELVSNVRFADMAFTMDFDDAEGGSSGTAAGTAQAVSLAASGTFGDGVMRDDFIDALRAGFRTDLALSYGPTQATIAVTDATGPTNITASNQGGALGFAVDAARIAYQGGAKGVNIAISAPDIPFPQVTLAYAQSQLDVAVPVAANPAPQDFAFLARLIDLTVSDEVWAMIDPGVTIPRDPATLIIDTRAKATLAVDLMDEAAMGALGGAPPGTLESLDIPALQLKVGGADFTGNGALTFDNTDLASFGGIPAPTGTINLKVLGANKLLDSLIALGLVPADGAMQARMMMGMFARPGAEPDSLESVLEFKDGGFSANGIQLQ